MCVGLAAKVVSVKDGTAVIDAAEGESFEITVLNAESEDAEPDEYVFTGEGTGTEVTLGTEDDTDVMDNAEGVLLSVNGEEAAYAEAG